MAASQAALEGAARPSPGRALGWGQVLPCDLPASVTSGAPRRGRGDGLSHCQTPPQRTLSASAWWAWALCLLPPEGGGGESLARAAAGPGSAHPASPLTRAWRPGQGSHRGTAGARLLLGVRRLGGILPTSGARQSGFSPALGRLGGRVLVLLGQGEEVAEPEGERGRSEGGCPGPRATLPPLSLIYVQAPGLAGDSVCAPRRPPSPTPSPFSGPQAQGASLHLVSFITARLDVLQSLQNRSLAEN